MNRIDTRNLHCPAPVIMAKKALENSQGEPLEIITDSGAPRENIIRFAESRGYEVTEHSEDGYCLLTVTNPLATAMTSANPGPAQSPGMLISTDCFGHGPEELGKLLMKNFIITLLEVPSQADRIFLINRGVLLAVEGSEVLEPLTKLANTGVEIFACGVCLDYFSVRDRLAIGSVTNMYTIAEALTSPGSLIKI